MKHRPRTAACLLAGGFVLCAAAAQSNPPIDHAPAAAVAVTAARAQAPNTPAITLAAALDLAWQRAVSARESEAQRRRADAERSSASRLWAAPPTLELGHRSERGNGQAGSRETELGVAVPMWLPGQRAARTAAAESALAHAEAAAQVARLRLAGELREAAWTLVALHAEAAQVEALTVSHRQLSDDVERRVRAGDLARADALAARAEHLAAQARQLDLQQRLQVARMHWSQLTGTAASPALDGAAGPEQAGATGAAADPSHPEIQLARLAIDRARQQLELLRQSRRDPPELTLGLRQDVPGRGEAGRNSLVVGLRLPFATDDRNRPLEAAALGELDIAQATEQRLRERLDGELASSRHALQAARAQLDAEAARARLLRERAILIDKSFRAGETPLPDLLRALSAAAQADATVALQTAALGLARARLQQALGLLP